MQIMIEIPDAYTKGVKIENGSLVAKKILDAVYSGTPLPKGHGRLIDAAKVIDTINREYPSVDRWDIKQWIEDADSVIEADKEKSEEVRITKQEVIDIKDKKDKLEELFERVENIEKQIKEDKEEQLKKLKAELDYAKFRCVLPIIMNMTPYN